MKKRREKIISPKIEGFSFEERAYFLEKRAFVAKQERGFSKLNSFLRPLFLENVKYKNQKKVTKVKDWKVKATIDMGKAVFLEKSININKERFNFLQWKGTGENIINKQMVASARKNGRIEFPLGTATKWPFFILKIRRRTLVRFLGGAFFEDLLIEREKTRIVEKMGLRVPKIVTTFKFTRFFAEKNNLPRPKKDKFENIKGLNWAKYLEKIKDQKVKEEILRSVEGKRKSIILGENIRAFRNIWRLSELEKILEDKNKVQRKNNLKKLISFSQQVLFQENEGKSRGKEGDFFQNFTTILARQTAILVNNSLIHNALWDHKQNVTLAAEICDFDRMIQIKNFKKARILEKRKLFWQIFLLSYYLQPLIRAEGIIKSRKVKKHFFLKIFFQELEKNLKEKRKQEIKFFLKREENLEELKRKIEEDEKIRKNFSNANDYFICLKKLINKGDFA